MGATLSGWLMKNAGKGRGFIIIFLSSMAEVEGPAIQSKKASCQVAKFHYHLSNTLPELFPADPPSSSGQSSPILRCRRGVRSMTYYFAEQQVEGVSSLDAQAIMDSARKLYIHSECVRVSATSFRRVRDYKVPYLPLYGRFQEIVEFHLIDRNETSGSSSFRSKVRGKNTSASSSKVREVDEEQSISKQPPKIKLPNNFELFVIHHCHGEGKEEMKQMRWESFIERYQFVEEGFGEDVKHRMQYSLMLNYQEEEGMLSYFTPHHKLYDLFLADYLVQNEGGLQHLSKMQGFLMLSKERVDRKLKQLNDPSHQESHKRWLKLPSEYYKQFTTLKKHTVSYYNSLHSEPKHSQATLNNLICRYMHANDYNYKLTLDSTMDYLKWEQQMAQDYSLQMFADIHKIDFFTFLGYDFQGRTVVLNRAAHLVVDQIKDVEQYCLYYIYYLEIWLQRKYKGYADQYTVIADVAGLGSDNFKLAITKRNMSDCLKFCPERQHKLIAVNVSVFATFVWGVIKPLLPKRTVSKLSIAGSEKSEILENLTKEMDITVIPEYLGGKNTRVCTDDLEDEEETHPIGHPQ